jgi:hypothetical protein|tara:strand:+ start:1408 stop:1584 length:177 start_codon:yes stop_codon:yes gene_type:complete
MKARVKISASVDSDAYWIPSDGISGIESDLEGLIAEAIEECLDGLEIKQIEVTLYGNI